MQSHKKKTTGLKKALLIGINYYHSGNQLTGCQDDVDNMHEYLKTCGFTDFTVLKDAKNDPHHQAVDCPTRDNIIAAMALFVKEAADGDELYVHYSGHGSQLPCNSPNDGNEKDGKDECICPVDFASGKKDDGFIRDIDLNAILVAPLPAGVKMRVCFDSCHSGSALDLPYMWKTGLKVIRETKLEVDRDVVFISGCRDSQTSADTEFNGQAQGAMTWALLQSISKLKADHTHTWTDLVDLMRKNLAAKKYDQVPQLSVESQHQLKNLIDLIPE